MSDRWPKATREHPCPKCGKFNRCLIAPDGFAGICWRSGMKAVWRVDGHSNGNGHASSYVGKAHRPKPSRKSAARSCATREQAINAALIGVRRDHPDAEMACLYEYRAFCVARFEWTGDKTFRPVHCDKNQWFEGDPSGALPLYHVDDLPIDEMIYVVEGEKACDAARAIGLTATTSAHGSSSAEKSDWTRCAGRDVTILPDADTAGEKYAQCVTAILVRLNPPAMVRIVKLPGLPDGGDVVEFLAAGGTREQIELLAKAATVVDSAGEPWPDPQSLPAGLPPVMAFDFALLSESCHGWIKSL